MIHRDKSINLTTTARVVCACAAFLVGCSTEPNVIGLSSGLPDAATDSGGDGTSESDTDPADVDVHTPPLDADHDSDAERSDAIDDVGVDAADVQDATTDAEDAVDGGDDADAGVEDAPVEDATLEDVPDADSGDIGSPDAVDARDVDTGTDASEDTGDDLCGNGRRDPGELCDGADVGDVSCSDFDFDGGRLLCAVDRCDGYDFAACTRVGTACGDDTAEGEEVCDGDDLRGATCRSRGFDSGTLRCAAGCRAFDESLCVSECTPACGSRVCGADPVCGVSCGSCDDGFSCDGGACVGDGSNAPTIVTFAVNRTRITESESVRFSAVVTDVDGIDDVIGGTLVDPSTGNSYGSFATAAAEGAYQIELTWNEIHDVDPIAFVTARTREFEANFFDVAGNRTQRTVSIELYCDTAALSGACDGACTDLTRPTTCGACDATCDTGGVCVADAETYRCDCPAGEIVCDGACVPNDAPPHCGTCGETCGDLGPYGECIDRSCACPAGFVECGGTCVSPYAMDTCGEACGRCSGDQFCSGTGCEPPLEGAARLTEGGWVELYHAGQWRALCGDSYPFSGFGGGEAEVVCGELGGTDVQWETGVTLPAGTPQWSRRRCGASDSRWDECEDDPWDYVAERCEDEVGVWLACTLERPGGCRATDGSSVRINEVYYASFSTNDDFIELRGTPGESLSGFVVETWRSTGDLASEWVLPRRAVVPDDGLLVLGGSAVAERDYSFPGLDARDVGAVRITDCVGRALDGVAYGVTSTAPATAYGEGFPFSGVYRRSESMGRREWDPASDTDFNLLDFFPFAAPSPGAPNAVRSTRADPPNMLAMSANGGAPRFAQPTTTCGATASQRRYASVSLTNTSGSDEHITLTAAFDGGADGMMHVYRGGFSSASATANCVYGNDGGSVPSEPYLEVIHWPPGEVLTIVLSTASGAEEFSATLETYLEP